jgi:hypothetical protein
MEVSRDRFDTTEVPGMSDGSASILDAFKHHSIATHLHRTSAIVIGSQSGGPNERRAIPSPVH